jgi:membrane associated rhomboid family serine protease
MFFIPYRDETPSRSFPFLTLSLIAANIYVFIRTYQPELFDAAVAHYGFTPEAAITHPQVILTSLFLHAGLLHLIGNMWFLWLFGDNIEDRFGRLSFVLLYFVAGIIGNVTNAFFTGFDSTFPMIGASGAVAGIMGAYFVRLPLARVRCVFILIFYPIFFRIHALWLFGLWMGFEFWNALSAVPGDHIAHWAHVGGFLVGALWGWGRKDRVFRQPSW